ncbi:hypothetical protein [Treponema putidum]|uniref:hypothetical protein n=1 Tax=Treponema putidum TaxID=221027 RepID=UPI003D92B87A
MKTISLEFDKINSNPIIKRIAVRSVITKSNLPVSDYSVNPYIGCTHACKYCYASFMKRFTGHTEPWGTFLDFKDWPEIKHPEKYAGKELFFGSVTDPYNPEEGYVRAHPYAALTAERQRCKNKHCNKKRFSLARFGYNQEFSQRPRFMVD